MNKPLKKLWNIYTDRLGRTIFHPQYIKKTLEYYAIEKAQKYATGTLVDVGCGRMPYRDVFESGGCTYVGVDHPSVSKLYTPDRKPEIYADAIALPFNRQSVDTVINFQVLNYISEPQKFFHEVSRVLKPGGALVLSAAFLYPLIDVPHDKARYTPDALKEFVKNTDLRIVSMDVYGGFVETWLQYLTFQLFKEIEYLISNRSGILQLAYLGFLAVISPFIIVTANIVVWLKRILFKTTLSKQNYFPLELLLVARKKHEKKTRTRSH